MLQSDAHTIRTSLHVEQSHIRPLRIFCRNIHCSVQYTEGVIANHLIKYMPNLDHISATKLRKEKKISTHYQFLIQLTQIASYSIFSTKQKGSYSNTSQDTFEAKNRIIGTIPIEGAYCQLTIPPAEAHEIYLPCSIKKQLKRLPGYPRCIASLQELSMKHLMLRPLAVKVAVSFAS